MAQAIAATVGTFDGVHCGHAAILDRLSGIAVENGHRAIAYVLDPHPLALVAPERAPALLTTPAERCRLIAERWPDIEPCVLNFTEALRRLTAAGFMLSLREKEDIRTIVMGYDNTFGSDRLTSAAEYEAAGRSAGVEVEHAGEVFVDGRHVSSTAVRHAVLSGDMDLVSKLLGRDFELRGTVVHGRRIGHEIGFPTANVSVPGGMIVPGNGVYAAAARVDGVTVPAMVNIGTAPTVADDGHRTIEAHLIDYNGDIYDRNIELKFRHFMRAEQRFASLEALARQLDDDRRVALEYFA